ncbi:MAG: bacterial regulatory helix-turn-helix, lysR family protein [Caulobacteraceae bacterium]|nr:bacterial regulatory helix-turn-helix, lysR family protein [Caulobacteraceae bacterium]
MAPATVRRHLDTLEARLGVTLFIRNPEGLSPTSAAMELGPIAEAMEGAVAAFARAASGARDEMRGLVKITSGEALGLELLLPILSDIRRAHPSLRFALGIDAGVTPLIRGAADVAVLLSPPRPDNLVLRPAGRFDVGIFAHRHYLEQYGTPQTMADLSRHALIGTEDEQLATQVENRIGLRAGAENFVLVAESVMGQVAAIRAGLGIGFCLAAKVAGDPQIVRVLPEVSALEFSVTVASRAEQEHMARVAFVRDAIARALSTRFATVADEAEGFDTVASPVPFRPVRV